MIPGKNILIDGFETLYMIQEQLKDKNINVVGIISENNDVKTYRLTDKIYKNYTINLWIYIPFPQAYIFSLEVINSSSTSGPVVVGFSFILLLIATN